MGNVKTAISVQRALFEQAELLAQEMSIARSRLYSLALQEFIRRYENQKLLEAINSAYDSGPHTAEDTRLHGMRRQHRRMVEGEW